jgi:hypothetical protein
MTGGVNDKSAVTTGQKRQRQRKVFGIKPKFFFLEIQFF